jgi:hypothetical protein
MQLLILWERWVDNVDTDWRSKDYKDFKTGLDFVQVWEILKNEQLHEKRKHVTRHTILGKWHEIKLRMWNDYLEQYEKWIESGDD